MDNIELLSRLDNWQPYHAEFNTRCIIEEAAQRIREQAETLDAMTGDEPVIRIARKTRRATLIIHD